MQLARRAAAATALHHLLFQRARYCARLADAFAGRVEAGTGPFSELRRFYRLGGEGKLDRIARLA